MAYSTPGAAELRAEPGPGESAGHDAAPDRDGAAAGGIAAGIVVQPLPPERVIGEWSHLGPLIAKAAVPAGYSLEHVLAQVMLRHMQVWRVGDQAASVTSINVLPLHKVATVLFLGGYGIDEWFEDLMFHVEQWALSEDCKYVECHGRQAWKRIGKPLGYEPVRITMRKRLG